MCRMTDLGVRLNRAIDKPGLWAVLPAWKEQARYMRVGDDPVTKEFIRQSYRPEYFIRVRLREWGQF